MLAGGIEPALNLRTTFSHVSACSPMLSGFRRSNMIPPGAGLRRSLWQVTQYLFSTARSGETAGVAVGCVDGVCEMLFWFCEAAANIAEGGCTASGSPMTAVAALT